jgi:calcium permeable stress-gated cation channel
LFSLAHRFLVGYVYARTHSQTGGLLQIWLLRRFGTVLSFQPILLGLIFLTRQFWIEGGVLVGTGFIVIVFVEFYASWKTSLPGRKSLSPITRNSLETFANATRRYFENDSGTINDSSVPGTRTRGSMASVLEMMSTTLAVMPSSSNFKDVVPLRMLISQRLPGVCVLMFIFPM